MKSIFAAAVTCLFVISIRFYPATAAKEEPEDESNRSLNNVYDSVLEELASSLRPEDLYPLCSSFAAYYDHVQKKSFNAWGGKKSIPTEGKRENFNPWGGKRSVAVPDMEKRENNFNPWGGKRSVVGEVPDMEKKENNFNPWGGKRTAAPELEKKNNFNPWGGKRFLSLAELQKKANNFNPWGGKRHAFLLSRTIKNDKPTFNPWGGR